MLLRPPPTEQPTPRHPFSSSRFLQKLLAVHWFKRLSWSWQLCLPIAFAIVLAWNIAAVAQTPPPPDPVKMAQELKVGLDTIWVMIAGMLVIFMNAGFCMLEAGMCRQKNAVNVLAKNLIVFALSTIAFWVMGFGLMFSNGNGLLAVAVGFSWLVLITVRPWLVTTRYFRRAQLDRDSPGGKVFLPVSLCGDCGHDCLWGRGRAH